ncbi:hypothetical protein GGR32_001061 [Mesonia hippocampi]|uniref:Uncharacterized protein n=1 Tax=Mesonia hippocampi TaxID=1628250 RepID=A0A840ENZ2_9FLAO|nr:hypothetical protein [Mesonia hippocampi]
MLNKISLNNKKEIYSICNQLLASHSTDKKIKPLKTAYIKLT